MKKWIVTVMSVFLTLVLYCNASATPLGGLAVALSPKGDVLIAAGDNRTLYVIDAAKMEVVNRVWLGVCIVDLQFNKDGSVALAEDTDGALQLIDSKTWKPVKQAPKASKISPARDVDLVAALNPDYNGNIIQFLSMTDLSEKGKVTFAKGEKVTALGLDPKGARLAVLLEAVNDESEPKASSTPPELKGLAADEFRLKNDGKTSRFMVFKVADGSKISEHKLFYSTSSSDWEIYFQGDDALIVNYSNMNAKVNPKGEVVLFQLQNSFNYGIGASADQKLILTGGLSEGSYTKAEGLSATKFQPDRLQGWPEYFKKFAVAADGKAYGSTSAFRIIRINPGGAFDKSFPVF